MSLKKLIIYNIFLMGFMSAAMNDDQVVYWSFDVAAAQRVIVQERESRVKKNVWNTLKYFFVKRRYLRRTETVTFQQYNNDRFEIDSQEEAE